MAISDTITSMYDNVGEVYDTITNVSLPEHKNIENIPSTIRESYLEIMNNGTDVVWDNWEKVVGEGTELTLSDTEQAPMKVLLKGNTYQDSTTGINLFCPDGVSTTRNGITVTNNGDGTFTINGTATNNVAISLTIGSRGKELIGSQAYTLAMDIISNGNSRGSVTCEIDKNGTTQYNFFSIAPAQETGMKVQVSTPSENATIKDIAYYVANGLEVNNLKIRLYLVKGSYTASTIPPYEPYTNGASPNPDYPQEVHVVSGDNEVDVVGKNLATLKGLGSSIGDVSFTVENGIIKINGTTTGGGKSNYGEPFRTKDGEAVFSVEVEGYTDKTSGNSAILIQQSDDGTSGWSTFKEINLKSTTYKQISATLDSTKYYRIRWWVEDNTFTNAEIKVMLEYGNEKTIWEKYTSQSYPINLPEGMFLGSIGDYKDTFFKTSGKNLLDKTLVVKGSTGKYFSNVNNPLTLKAGTYSVSFKNPKSTYSWSRFVVIDGTPTNFNQSSDSTISYSFTLTQESSVYIQNNLYVSGNATNISDDDMAIVKDTIMLNEGTTALPYEPYGSNEWYLEKKIGKVVLTGSETWGGSSANGYYYALNEMLRTNDYRLAIKSNYYTIGQDYRSGYHEDKQMTGYYVTTQSYPGQNWIYIFDTSYSDKTVLATWLSTHNTEVYYVLSTPTYTKIEGTLASQLEEVYRAKSKEGQTNISQVNNDLPFILDVSALKEI